MGSFTGRASTGRASRLGKGLFDTLVDITDSMHDNGLQIQVREIDEQIETLRRERDDLVSRMYEPGDFKVSSDYDPSWRKPVSRPTSSSNGRLTHCDGRSYSGKWHGAHPGCPYIETIHGEHDFTLRD